MIEHWHQMGAMDLLLLRQEHPSGIDDFIELIDEKNRVFLNSLGTI